jgi:hypothetical protein
MVQEGYDKKSIIENELNILDFNVYPNSASARKTLGLKVESSEDLELTIIHLKGQAVSHAECSPTGTVPCSGR